MASEALQGIKTINEIAQANELALIQVSQLKKELEGLVPEIFAGKNDSKSGVVLEERQEQRLERNVGQLVIEKEFLEKSARSWG